MKLKRIILVCFVAMLSIFTTTVFSGEKLSNEFVRVSFDGDDTLKTEGSTKASMLDIDEGIKCSRAELLEREFFAIGANKYGEILRITFQDLERGAREIIFQKKLMENDNVKFYMPNDLIKEAKTAVLIVMKGDKMYFKKIDLTDEE